MIPGKTRLPRADPLHGRSCKKPLLFCHGRTRENLLLFFFEWAKDNGYTQYYDFFILFYEELKSMIYEIDSPFYTEKDFDEKQEERT